MLPPAFAHVALPFKCYHLDNLIKGIRRVLKQCFGSCGEVELHVLLKHNFMSCLSFASKEKALSVTVYPAFFMSLSYKSTTSPSVVSKSSYTLGEAPPSAYFQEIIVLQLLSRYHCSSTVCQCMVVLATLLMFQ